MDDFCNDGSTFWNRSITWDTTDPYFTSCFEETILVWVPAGFLIFFALLDLNYSLKSRYANDPIPWNFLSILKSLVCVALIAVALAELIKIQGYEQSKAIDSVSSAARLVSYILALVLLVLAKVKGIRSSGVQFLFWLLATICEAILFRTAVRKYESSDDTRMNFVYLMRFIIFPLVAIQLILNCWADGNWANKSGKESIFGFPPPDKSSSYLSKLLYLWYDSMAWKGYRQPLSFDDLWDLNDADKAGVQLPIFQEHWNEAVKRAKEQSKKAGKKVEAGIMSVLWKCYGTPFMAGGLMKLIQDLLAFVSPEILKMLMAHVTANRITGELTEESWKGYLYASILLVVGLIQTLFGVQHNKRMMLVGMKIRTTLSSAVYRKALLVSTAAKKDTTVGEIVNLMSVDTQKFMDLAPMVHMAWTAPIQVALSIYFLYNILGPAVFAGLAVMVLLIPLNGVVSGMARSLQFRQMKLKDRRVKLMSEFLAGMKVLKLYGWEPSFQEQIMKIRAQELKLLKKAAMLNTSIMFMFTCAPYLVSLATFATYVLSDETHNLNAERAFVSLTLFNIMRMPLTMFPMVIASLVQASVSVQRLNKYMNSEEIDLTAVSHKENSEEPITIKKGKFSWTDETITLQDIDFTVKKGSLTAVVGSVGSGKSSLLGSLLGDLKKHEGDVNISGSVAFVSQGAWIQNATLRENILFNDPFILSKYNKVIKACNLEPDLDILEAGDQTEIGEKGINLSGGQKQRVSLARAAYKESEVYLFDDPLSAVDSHVGKHIFDQLIGPGGILRDKTRVLVTHGVAFLPQVDNIVVMADGRISEVGTFKELLSRKGKFAEFLTQHLTNLSDGEELDMSLVQELEDVVGADVFKRNSSLVVRRRSTQDSLGKQKDEMSVVEKPKPKLMQEEIAETGSVKLEVYADYLRTAGIGMSITTLVMNLIATGSATYSNIWLSDWSTEATLDEIKNNGTQDRDTTNLYLGVYGGLGGINAFAILFASLTLALATLRSAASLHFRMLDRVMKAPMSYFDTTPLGRLVNRFAKDVDTTDILVPMNIRASLNIVLNVLSAVVNISYSTPFFLIFIIPLFIFYFFMQRFYVATSRQLKRIESVTRSPIYSKFGETISGSTTIRAFNLQEDFIGESEKKIDINQQAYFPYIASSLWIAVRLEALGSLIVFAAAIFAVTARETIEASVVGLSISSALTFTGLLNFLVRTTSDLETNIIAVERMKELTTAPQEAAWIGEKRPRKEWPENGAVEFKDYQTRYREGLDLVLRGITCKINPGEKIGIVGRTGAGKSSLTLALFRLVEPVAGSICIDGQNITEIGLHDLRQKITIIPQDPVLFSGNLQGNLDPFGVFSDDQLWTCLESAHLKQYVSSLPLKLQHEVAEEGQNFSVGQRQLVCLARALLRKTKILVLDEATAAVDLETDDLIQRTIRTEFEHSTVLTIAHRLNTIMDSTRVVVLDKGEIVEFDTPANLLENTNSIFYSMAKDAGLV